MKIFLKFVSLLAFLVSAALCSGCGRVFFFPSKKLVIDPAEVLLDFEDVYFESDEGVRLHGWFLPAEGEATGTIVFLHGNAENIGNHLAAVYWLPKEGFNVFLFDYRGFGKSEGTPDIAGSIKDAEAAFREMLDREDVDENKMILFGQSLGGAFAINMAAQSELRPYIKVLVVENTFTSFRAIAREKLGRYWLTTPLKWPFSFLIPAAFDPIDVIAQISPIPLLIIHGDRDEVVPVEHGKKLFERALEPKRFWLIPGGEHIAAFRQPKYRRQMVDYLRSQLATTMASLSRVRDGR